MHGAMKAPAWKDTSIAANGHSVQDNLRAWLSGSKVVDAEGDPLVLYHGSLLDFDEFRPNDAGLIFLTDSPGEAANYAVHKSWSGPEVAQPVVLMPCFVRACSPFEAADSACLRQVEPHVDFDAVAEQLQELSLLDWTAQQARRWFCEGAWQALETPEVLRCIREAGFDGLWVQELGLRNLAVFEPAQVKSALGNSGLFLRHSASLTDRDAAMALERGLVARRCLMEPSQEVRP